MDVKKEVRIVQDGQGGARLAPPRMDLDIGPQTITFDHVTADWRYGRWHVALRLGDREVWGIDTPDSPDISRARGRA